MPALLFTGLIFTVLKKVSVRSINSVALRRLVLLRHLPLFVAFFMFSLSIRLLLTFKKRLIVSQSLLIDEQYSRYSVYDIEPCFYYTGIRFDGDLA